MNCTYNNGRVCGKPATVRFEGAMVEMTSCNGHRIATANMIAEIDTDIATVELPRERTAPAEDAAPAEPVAPARTAPAEIWFKATKSGRRRAYYFSTLAGRTLPYPMADAEFAIATGQSIEVDQPSWLVRR